MSDLISRSALFEKLEKDSTYDLDFYDSELREIIETQPTAYDIEKVVAELEEEHKKAFGKYREAFELYREEFWRGRMSGLTSAIEIVRKGGAT